MDSMADDNLMSQDEIERLLNAAKPAAGNPEPPPAATPAPGPPLPDLSDITAQSAPPAQDSGIASDGTKLLGQDDIDKILGNAAAVSPATVEAVAPPPPPPDDGSLAPGDLDYLLNQAEQALASVQSGGSSTPPPGVTAFRLEELNGAAPSQDNTTLDLIRDVELDLKIELGRTNMYLEDVLRLRKGSVVPLDKLAGDPVDIYVNDRLVARGEVLVLNDNFCVRVAELIAGVSPAA
jgi:flagellar motor switch protein FliN/FliY